MRRCGKTSGTPADAAIASANPGQTVTLAGGKFDTNSYVQATYLSGGGNKAVRTLYPQAFAPDGSSANYQIPVDLGGIVTLSLAGAANDVPVQVVPFVTQVTGSPSRNITISGRGFVDDVPSNYDIGGINVARLSMVRRAGAVGVAVVSAICGHPDVAAATRTLRIAWDGASG